MKRIVLLALFAIGLISSVAVQAHKPELSEKILGVWESDGVEMTFLKDTLIIDEIAVEGFEYSYKVSDNIITYNDDYTTDTVKIIIVSVDNTKLVIKYPDYDSTELIVFNRKKIQVPTLGF